MIPREDEANNIAGVAAAAQMATMTTSLSPGTTHMSAGSLVTTVTLSADIDPMTAPTCASATETPVCTRIAAAALAWPASSGTSAIRRRVGHPHAAQVRSPP